MMKKKISALFLVAAVSLSYASLTQAGAATTMNTVSFKLNDHTYINGAGKQLLKTAPYALNGSSMIPVRAMAESLGAAVSWDAKTQTIALTGKSFGQIKLPIQSNYAVNAKGEQVKLPERVQRVKGTLFVPARALANLMGAKLDWEPSTGKMTLTQQQSITDRIEVKYTFDQGVEGWKGGFADLPVNGDKSIYELEYNRSIIPLKDKKDNYGLKLTGHNRSDDLFMFLSRAVGGFTPNTTYDVKLNFALYTDQGGGMAGIGGSSGSSVYVKAGILSKEPLSVPTDYAGSKYYRMNVDVGSQSQGGKDAAMLGNIEKPDSEKEGYQRVDFHHSAKVKSNEKGEIFLLIGTDSGFEGLTTLYYDDITVTATKAK